MCLVKPVDASPKKGSAVNFLGCNDCCYIILFQAGILNGTKYLQLLYYLSWDVCWKAKFYGYVHALQKRVKIPNGCVFSCKKSHQCNPCIKIFRNEELKSSIKCHPYWGEDQTWCWNVAVFFAWWVFPKNIKALFGSAAHHDLKKQLNRRATVGSYWEIWWASSVCVFLFS